MLLPPGLQLWVLGESPHAGTAWCHSHWVPHAAAVRAPVGMGEDAPGSCGDSGGHFIAVALSVWCHQPEDVWLGEIVLFVLRPTAAALKPSLLGKQRWCLLCPGHPSELVVSPCLAGGSFQWVREG